MRLIFPAAALLAATLLAACGDHNGAGQPSASAGTPTASASPGPVPTLPAISAEGLAIPNPVQLYVAEADGSGSKLIAEAAGQLSYSWAPDGRIAVVSGPEMSVLRVLDGSGEITDSFEIGGFAYMDPVWSPDGEQVIVVRDKNAQQELIAVDVWSGRIRILDSSGGSSFSIGEWTASGELTALAGGTLKAYDAVTGSSRTLSDHVAVQSAGAPSVSPDGTKVAIAIEGSCFTTANAGPGSIAIVDLAGGGEQVVAAPNCSISDLDWSPDGTQLAVSVVMLPDSQGIYLIDIATGAQQRLSSEIDAGVEWLADGTILAFRYLCWFCEGGPPGVFVLDPDGGPERQVVPISENELANSEDRLAAFSDNELRIVGLDGTVQATLVEGEAGWRPYAVEWSPDDARVAFLRSHVMGTRTFEIGADGSGFEETSYAGGGEVVSPDGRYAVVTEPTKVEKEAILFVEDLATGERTRVDVSPSGLPVWSPDSTRFAINGGASTPVAVAEMAYYIVSLDGTATVTKYTDAKGPTGSWSPDGELYGLSGDSGVVVIEAETGDYRTVGEPNALYSPAWSADSEKLAYVSQGRIFVVNADGSEQKHVATPAQNVVSLALSPDGGSVAAILATMTGQKPPGAADKIVAFDVDTGEQRALVSESLAYPQPLAWSPDGEWLAFGVGQSDRWGIYLVRADGSEFRRLTNGFVNGPVTWLTDNRLAFTSYIGGL